MVAKDKSLVVVPQEKGLVQVQPLQRYLSEINKYPLLSREEEYDYAVKLYEEGDKKAANILVTSNLRLVVKIAMDYQKNYSNILDMIQEGNTGLIHAVKKYNPYKGVKLSSYAAWWIRAYVLKFLMDNKSMVKIGTTGAQRRLFFNLKKEAEKLYKSEGVLDTKLLAENLNVKEKEIEEVRGRILNSDVSLDAPVFDDSEATYQSYIPATVAPHDEMLIEKQIKERFSQMVQLFKKELAERDLYIFENRLLADKPLTLQEIGDNYGFTRERARQLEKRLMKKFQEFLKERGFSN